MLDMKEYKPPKGIPPILALINIMFTMLKDLMNMAFQLVLIGLRLVLLPIIILWDMFQGEATNLNKFVLPIQSKSLYERNVEMLRNKERRK